MTNCRLECLNFCHWDWPVKFAYATLCCSRSVLASAMCHLCKNFLSYLCIIIMCIYPSLITTIVLSSARLTPPKIGKFQSPLKVLWLDKNMKFGGKCRTKLLRTASTFKFFLLLFKWRNKNVIMLKKKTVLLLKMTEKDSRHVFKKRSCNNIFIMKNNMYY